MLVCLSEFLTRDLVAVRISLEACGRIREVVVASRYFPEDVTWIPPELVASLTKSCES